MSRDPAGLDDISAPERASIRETLCLCIHALTAAERSGQVGRVRDSDISNLHRIIDWATPGPTRETT